MLAGEDGVVYTKQFTANTPCLWEVVDKELVSAETLFLNEDQDRDGISDAESKTCSISIKANSLADAATIIVYPQDTQSYKVTEFSIQQRLH